jgi:hypothetical protein
VTRTTWRSSARRARPGERAAGGGGRAPARGHGPGEVLHPAGDGRYRPGRAKRRPPGRRADRGRLLGPVLRGYREIPLADGESIGDASVLEQSQPYRPGSCTDIGCHDAPGTFGVAHLPRQGPDRLALQRRRRDPHVRAPLYAEQARRRLQRRARRRPERLGRPADGRARPADGVARRPRQDRPRLGQPGLRPRRRAALRRPQPTCAPRTSPHTSWSSYACWSPAPPSPRGPRCASPTARGLAKIVAAEQGETAALERQHARITHAERHPWKYVLLLLLLGTLPGLAIVGAAFWLLGREPAGYDREYEQEPTRDTSRRSCRRCSARAAPRARSNSRRRCST